MLVGKIIGGSLAHSFDGAAGAPGAQTPTVKSYTSRNPPDQRTSYLFDGAVNTVAQGGPVPIIYGRMRVGSVVVSAGINSVRD